MNRRHHEVGCPQRDHPGNPCDCAAIEDELIPGTLPGLDQPYQSLADLIRAARREGLLRPLQPYGGGRTPAPVP